MNKITEIPNSSYIKEYKDLLQYNNYVVKHLSKIKNKNYIKILYLVQEKVYIVFTPETINNYVKEHEKEIENNLNGKLLPEIGK